VESNARQMPVREFNRRLRLQARQTCSINDFSNLSQVMTHLIRVSQAPSLKTKGSPDEGVQGVVVLTKSSELFSTDGSHGRR
jgi:hypothetical protein